MANWVRCLDGGGVSTVGNGQNFGDIHLQAWRRVIVCNNDCGCSGVWCRKFTLVSFDLDPFGRFTTNLRFDPLPPVGISPYVFLEHGNMFTRAMVTKL